MFENTYIREKITGTHKSLISHLKKEELLNALSSINAQISVALDDHIPTSHNYREKLRVLLKRYYKLRDDESEKKDPDYFDNLMDLASDFVKFEFEVGAETE